MNGPVPHWPVLQVQGDFQGEHGCSYLFCLEMDGDAQSEFLLDIPEA